MLAVSGWNRENGKQAAPYSTAMTMSDRRLPTVQLWDAGFNQTALLTGCQPLTNQGVRQVLKFEVFHLVSRSRVVQQLSFILTSLVETGWKKRHHDQQVKPEDYISGSKTLLIEQVELIGVNSKHGDQC